MEAQLELCAHGPPHGRCGPHGAEPNGATARTARGLTAAIQGERPRASGQGRAAKGERPGVSRPVTAVITGRLTPGRSPLVARRSRNLHDLTAIAGEQRPQVRGGYLGGQELD